VTGEPDLLRRAGAHPPTALLRYARHPAKGLLRLWWRISVHGSEHEPSTGPVILASNHVGLIDGPLIAIEGPRPVHALAKREMFESRAGWVLRASGQIRLDRFAVDPAAVRTCARVLDSGGVVGVFPEGTRGDGMLHEIHRGAAYLALLSGAPVVPVSMFGTREPGAGKSTLPPRRAHLEVVYGRAWQVSPVAWPRTREQVGTTTALLLEHLRSELGRAIALTGRSLPGPLPAGESKDGPRPGPVDQGAP
jgi:1-acyl-sn-glycerol-3-phosphate acyltransferase